MKHLTARSQLMGACCGIHKSCYENTFLWEKGVNEEGFLLVVKDNMPDYSRELSYRRKDVLPMDESVYPLRPNYKTCETGYNPNSHKVRKYKDMSRNTLILGPELLILNNGPIPITTIDRNGIAQTFEPFCFGEVDKQHIAVVELVPFRVPLNFHYGYVVTADDVKRIIYQQMNSFTAEKYGKDADLVAKMISKRSQKPEGEIYPNSIRSIRVTYLSNVEIATLMSGDSYFLEEYGLVMSSALNNEFPVNPATQTTFLNTSGLYKNLDNIGFVTYIVDNKSRVRDKYMNILGSSYLVPKFEDETQKEGLYIYKNEDGEMKPVMFLEIHEVREAVFLYNTEEEALINADYLSSLTGKIKEKELEIKLKDHDLSKEKINNEIKKIEQSEKESERADFQRKTERREASNISRTKQKHEKFKAVLDVLGNLIKFVIFGWTMYVKGK